MWWGLLGIGVAALFYFLSASKQSSQNAQTVTVPYLVPQTLNSNGASPSAGPSLSTQPNIIGSSPNSTISNFANPYTTNPFEAPGTWGYMPQLIATNPNGPTNNIQFGGFSPVNNALVPNAVPQQQSPVHA